jgi:putative transposase
MAAPPRGNTGHSCYFVTASTFQKRNLFQPERMARLFVDVLFHYRRQGKFLLHEFVLMPDHFHVLLTPTETLERALQLIKGGFSFRARKELGFGGEIWQKSFYDRRVRDVHEYFAFRDYIHRNPEGEFGFCGGRVCLQFRQGRVSDGWITSAVEAGRCECLKRSAGSAAPPKGGEPKSLNFGSDCLPASGLQHVRLVQARDGQAFHRSLQVFADFK